MQRQGYRSPGWSASGYLNIFEGSYGDGETRILAQEPVQNAKDARRGAETVHVEYRLMQRVTNDGMPFHLLAVTDRGTTGLCGNTNPSPATLARASAADKEYLKWYHFERLFDSNKNQLQNGSRGWGKTIFLKCSRVPYAPQSAMMIYDSLLENGEYRVGDMTIWNDELGVREQPLLNEEARRAVSALFYTTPDGNISLPMALKPLSETGTRVIVPFLSESAAQALRNGSLARWLQYLWWRPISLGSLTISMVCEVTGLRESIVEPEWWKGDIWSSNATEPGPIHKLHKGCHLQVIENSNLGSGCHVQRLAVLYDASLCDQKADNDGPDYAGIQMLRGGQCIETYWDFDRIPPKEKPGFRAFVEFDDGTDKKLRDIDITSHDRFKRIGIIRDPVLPYLKKRAHEFAESIGLIKRTSSDDAKSNEKFRRTSQFVFDRLLSKAMGNVTGDAPGDDAAGDADRPWDVDVLLNYPNPKSTRVNWGERISNLRFVIHSRPERLRPKTRLALDWQAPDGKRIELRSRKPLAGIDEFEFPDRVLTQREIDDHHIICPKPGIYRIRAAVFEGDKLVAKKARRIHVEEDPPVREENPYAVSISVENETSPGELRIESGDILRLQINGRNRTHDDVSGTLLLRMREDTLLAADIPFFMPGKPLGGDDRRHRLHGLRLQVVRGEPGAMVNEHGRLTLSLEPGRRTMQAYLLDERDEMAHGSRVLHFESEPANTQGGMPFELFQVLGGTPPMWDLRMEESKLHFAPDYPLNSALRQDPALETYAGHNPYELELNVNGLLQWAVEPLLEDEADSSRLESLRNAKPDLVDDYAWDKYMDCLSRLEAEMTNCRAGHSVSPLDFALNWRRTVAAIHPILIPPEND